jgi:hypothetical protein
MGFISVSSHRAFMITGSLLTSILLFSLGIGWHFHFKNVETRERLIALDNKAAKNRRYRSESEEQTTSSLKRTQLEDLSLEKKTTAQDQLISQTPGSIGTRSRKSATNLPQSDTVPPQVLIEALPQENAESVFEEARGVIAKYRKATVWQEKRRHIHDPQRVAALMQDYYEVQHQVDPEQGPEQAPMRYRVNGQEVCVMSYFGSRSIGSLEILLRRNPEGQLVIDWESYVGYSEKSFSELRTRKPTDATLIRAYVTLADYYNYEFSDADRYLSVKLSSPNEEEFFHAYCLRDSELGQWLLTDLASDPSAPITKSYTLWARFPVNPQSDRCLDLVKVSCSSWLIIPGSK